MKATRTLCRMAPNEMVIKTYDEAEIVDVLRRSGWFVVPAEQVAMLDAREVIDAPTAGSVRFPENFATLVRDSVRLKALEQVRDKLPVRQRDRSSMFNETVFEYRCRAYVVIPTEDDLDEMDRREGK